MEVSKGGFDALRLIGSFWMFFAVVVLVATFFVEEGANVPAARGRIVNLISGLILFAVGLVVFLKGVYNTRKRRMSAP